MEVRNQLGENRPNSTKSADDPSLAAVIGRALARPAAGEGVGRAETLSDFHRHFFDDQVVSGVVALLHLGLKKAAGFSARRVRRPLNLG